MTTDPLGIIAALMSSLQITPEALAAHLAAPMTTRSGPPPTVADYIDKAHAIANSGARQTYGTYWRKLREAMGPMPITDVLSSQLLTFVANVKESAVQRRNGRMGVGAAENCVGAIRAVFKIAVQDRIITTQLNPAAELKKPARPQSRRRALNERELGQVFDVVQTMVRDPNLDTLLVRFFVETGARREGALVLRCCDFNRDQQTIRLRKRTTPSDGSQFH